MRGVKCDRKLANLAFELVFSFYVPLHLNMYYKNNKSPSHAIANYNARAYVFMRKENNKLSRPLRCRKK